MRNVLAVVAVSILVAAVAHAIDMKKMSMESVAEAYVKLVLEIDQYDPGYVDAYFGPPEWRAAKPTDQPAIPIQPLLDRTGALLDALKRLNRTDFTPLRRLRYAYLEAHLRSAAARVELLNGRPRTFDAESRAIYGVVAPPQAVVNRDSLLNELDRLLPDNGPIADRGTIANRLDNFLKRFTVPTEQVAAVYDAALTEARRRTREHVTLPEGESLTLEFVKNEPWGAYNWFKGKGQSLVQVNVEQPVGVSGVLGTIVHEGYPGHHTNLTLLEKHLYRDSGWVEFSVVPLYCPMSVLSEGIANYANDVLFPDHEGEAFTKSVLFPVAGLDTTDADRYFRVQKIRAELGKLEVDIVRSYLDGAITADSAQRALVASAICTTKEAPRKMSFYDTYRSYLICYSVGKELVKSYVECGPSSERWKRFIDLLTTPRIPSTIK